GDEFERDRAGDHARDARVIGVGARVGGEPLLDVLGLADIEHLALAVDHAIDAGRGGRELEVARDGGTAGRQRARRRLVQLQIGQRRLFVVLAKVFARRVDVFFRAAHGRQDNTRAAPATVMVNKYLMLALARRTLAHAANASLRLTAAPG